MLRRCLSLASGLRRSAWFICLAFGSRVVPAQIKAGEKDKYEMTIDQKPTG